MSNFKAGDVIRAKVGCSPYFKSGDIGVVVDIEYLDGKIVFLHVDFNRAGQYAYEDGRWYLAPEEAAPWLGITKPALSGHSGVHDGLQNHSVGSCYPLSVVTYGHEPAIHVIENLTTGQVACLRTGHPWQFSSAGTAFTFLELLAAGGSGNYVLGPVVWVSGRPKNVNGILVVHESKHVLFNHAYNLEESRIGRPLTPYEVYQLACDIDNR